MGLFFDSEGRPVQLDDAEATQGYLSGQLSLPQRDRHNVRGPDGRVISVADAEIDSVLSQGGFTLAGDAEAAAQVRRDEAAASPIQAGLEGAARGATLGASDVVLEGLGAAMSNSPEGILRGAREARENIALRRELNPTAATVGEVAGSVAPMLVPGGQFTPAGMLMRAAEAGGARVTAGMAARGAGRIASRAAGMAAEGAFEGAVTGGAQALSEAHLEDRQLTAETLLAGIGMGGALGLGLGGALGGGVGAGEAAAARTADAVRRAASGTAGTVRDASRRLGAGTQRLLTSGQQIGRDTIDAVQSVYRRAAGPDAPDLNTGVAELWARGSSLATGADEQALRRMADLSPEGQAVRQIVTNADAVIEQAAREGREVLDQSERFARIVQDESIGSFKRENVARMLGGQMGTDALTQADEMLSFIGAQADEMLADTATWGERAAVSRIREDVDAVKRRILAAMDGGENELADVFIELDQFKRRMGRNARPGRFVASSQDASAVSRIRDWYEQTRRHLESGDLYGEAATAQQEINAAWTRYLANAENYRSTFMQRVGQDAFNPVYTHDPARLETYLRNTGRVKNDLAAEALRNHTASQRQLVEAIGKHFEISPSARKALEDGRTSAKALETWLDATGRGVGVINQFRAISEASKESAGLLGAGIGGTLGAIAGATVGLPGIGAAAGSAVGSLLVRPDAAIKTLAALERMNAAMGGRISKAVRGFLGTGEGTAPRALGAAAKRAGERAREAGKAVGEAAKRTGMAIERTAQRTGQAIERGARAAGRAGVEAGRASRRASTAYAVSTYESRAEQVRKAQADQAGFVARMEEVTAPIAGAAPQTSAQMAITAQKALQFLAQRMPQGRADRLQPLARPARISDQEKARWLRYARAVDDPLSVVDDLEAGELNREGVEALRELYPAIFARVQGQVAEQLATMTEPLPYSRRLQIGILFSLPADPSLDPDMITTLQATWQGAAQASPQAQPQTAPQSTGRAPDIASAAPMASAMDAFERRQSAAG